MVKITRDILLSKEGLEEVMAVDLNDSKNYVTNEQDFIVEARVAYALWDIGMIPNMFIEDTDEFIDPTPLEHRFLQSKLHKGCRYQIKNMYRKYGKAGSVVLEVHEADALGLYIRQRSIKELGDFEVAETRWVKIHATPAEFKRMLLIFDELKYMRNAHVILGIDIPKKKTKNMDCFRD